MQTRLSNLKAAAEVQRLALKLQNKGIAEVFLSFYGHVQQLEVKVYKPCWSTETKPIEDFRAYLDKPDEKYKLNHIILTLTNLLNNAK